MSSHLCMMMLFAWLSISSLFNLVQHFLVLMFGASFSIPVFFWSSIFQPQHLVSYFPALYLPPFDDLVLHFQSPRFRMVNVACKFDCGEINMSAFGFHLPVDFFMPAQLLSYSYLTTFFHWPCLSLQLCTCTPSFCRQAINLQTSTKNPSVLIFSYGLVILCQHLRFILRFSHCVNLFMVMIKALKETQSSDSVHCQSTPLYE